MTRRSHVDKRSKRTVPRQCVSDHGMHKDVVKKTEAQSIIEARRGSYATTLPSGFMDETELLLMQQHFAELRDRAKKKKLRTVS